MVRVSVPNVTVKVNITRSLALYPLVPASLPLAARLSSRDSFLSRAITFLLLIWNNRNKSNNAPPTTYDACSKYWDSFFSLPLVLPYLLLPFARTKEQYSKYLVIPPMRRRETLLKLKIFLSSRISRNSFLDLFVIIDQSHHVLPCLLEEILLHTLAYVMMKESSFLVHQVVFPGEHRPSVSHRRVVADHHHRPVRFCQITARDGRGWLIVNTYLRMHFFFSFPIKTVS